MFEELFEAFEEKLPPRAMENYSQSERPSVPRTKLKMNTQYDAFNPHLRHLSVDYKCASALSALACMLSSLHEHTHQVGRLAPEADVVVEGSCDRSC
jgi:hypothetical protein